MPHFFSAFCGWVAKWDFMAIFYSILAAIVFAAIAKWMGVIRFIKRKYLTFAKLKSYSKAVEKECSSLIVIGRRQGFSIKDVFVELDIAPSDLVKPGGRDKEIENSLPRNFVLIGGPGAGKSTFAKNMVIKKLEQGGAGYPFFIRLREYSDTQSIDSTFVDKLRRIGIPDPELFFKSQIENRQAVFILDGLDEVRPLHRSRVYDQINSFFNKNFKSCEGARLIVTCRKEAYREIPLDIPSIWEVRPLSDPQIKRFAEKWPLQFPSGKSADSFCRELFQLKRIHELARSPLLLVGGLMQYTESNLGIPAERIEYLQRIAKWLVSDWAIAQNHPTDPYRSVYDRILPRLAFHLHNSQKSECQIQEATSLLSKWLPDFGFQAENASSVLDSIMTRTGILVRDTSNECIFSQFGLQEYFASIHASESLTVKELAALEPKTWWREVLLLAIAQQKEPTPALEELFEKAPLLAATAVGECPTPSIAVQQKAVDVCLLGIDQADATALTAAISLLRKVAGPQERAFCDELEKRMVGKNKLAPTVAAILAAADTNNSTQIIAKYPHLWELCLQKVGFLSNTFENLLVDWISTKQDNNGTMAVDLLTSRLTSDRFNQLSGMLPNLSPERAEHLAIKLLTYLQNEDRHPFWVDSAMISKIAVCVAHVQHRDRFFKSFKQFPMHASILNIAGTALHIKECKARSRQENINLIVSDCIDWCQRRGSMLIWLSSSLCALGVLTCGNTRLLFVIASLLLFGTAIYKPWAPPPWLAGVFFLGNNAQGLTSILIAVSGATAVFGLGAKLSNNWLLVSSPVSILALSLALSLTGLALFLVDRYSYGQGRSPFKHNSFLSAACWASIVLIAIVIHTVFQGLSALYVFVVAALFTLWQSFIIARLFLHWNTARRASKQMHKAKALRSIDS
jgi:hypothetical protein